MTTKETYSELIELLKFKQGLTEKIDWNVKELAKIEAMESGEVEVRKDIAKSLAIGRKMVATLTAERSKLKNRAIAQQLGIKPHVVAYQARLLKEKHQGLSAKKQAQIAKNIEKSRQNKQSFIDGNNERAARRTA